MEKEKKSLKIIGILALVFSVLAFFTIITVFVSYFFAFISIILSIIVFVKKGEKIFGKVSIVLSIISILIVTVLLSMICYVDYLQKDKNNGEFLGEIVDKLILMMDKFDSSNWELNNGDIIKFNDKREFELYKKSSLKKDTYYKGEYGFYIGASAIKKIKNTNAFSEKKFNDFYKLNRNISEDNIYYLSIKSKYLVIDGIEYTLTDSSGNLELVLFFGNDKKVSGYNLNTNEHINIKEIK